MVKKTSESVDQVILSLLLEYREQLYYFLYKRLGTPDVSEDLVQDIFEKIYRNPLQLLQADHPKNWLFTVARNAALDYQKKNKNLDFKENELLDLKAIEPERAFAYSIEDRQFIDRVMLLYNREVTQLAIDLYNQTRKKQKGLPHWTKLSYAAKEQIQEKIYSKILAEKSNLIRLIDRRLSEPEANSDFLEEVRKSFGKLGSS